MQENWDLVASCNVDTLTDILFSIVKVDWSPVDAVRALNYLNQFDEKKSILNVFKTRLKTITDRMWRKLKELRLA